MAVNSQAQGPLVGYRVVELSSTIAGPVCARLFADFGADVIKIESAQGDPGRNIGAQFEGVSLYGASMYRNKRTVAVDLKTPAGRDIASRLIEQADIFVENLRPGVIERLGLGYDELKLRNPGLVLVRISGYGQTGPYSPLPGYGAICEAVAGVRNMTGDPDRPPARVALATTDYLTAVYAAFGALMALLERHRTKTGQVVDVALYEAAFSMMEAAVPAYEKTGAIPMRSGSRLMNTAPNSLYPAKDGNYVLIAANNDQIFARLARAMGQAELAEDPRYATQAARGEYADELDAMVTAWTIGYEGQEIQRRLIEAEVPVSRVYTIKDIFEDHHYRAREMLLRLPHPSLGSVTLAGIVPKLSASPGSVYRPGAAIGEDTYAVLRDELDMSDEQIKALQAQGAIHCLAPAAS